MNVPTMSFHRTTTERATEANAIREILDQAKKLEAGDTAARPGRPGSLARQVETAIKRNARVLKPRGIVGIRY